MPDFRTMYDNLFIGSWTFPEGKDFELVIDRVEAGEVTCEGGRKEHKPLLHFKGKKLPMVLSKRNGKALASHHGANTDKWSGKTVTVFVEQRMAFGEMMPVLSIRGRSSRGAAMRDRLAAPATNSDAPATREPGEDDA